MKHITYFIGVDIASDTFVVSVCKDPDNFISKATAWDNTPEGYDKFLSWLKDKGYTQNNCVVCMEATGVYSQGLSYFLASRDYTVTVEPPVEVKKSFPTHGHKNDPVDSANISEYAYRYIDKLHLWQPPDEVLKHIKTLLTTREHITRTLSSYYNSLRSLNRETILTTSAVDIHKRIIKELMTSIKDIDKQIKELIETDSSIKDMYTLVSSVPGVGLQLASHIMVMTGCGSNHLTYRNVASYVGISPWDHESGTSVRKRPRSKKNGPGMVRKLLYLAAMSLREHNDYFKEYFERKVAQGKSGKLVINNIANRLLKIIFGIIRTKRPYIKEYVSVPIP
jgi:transposase